MLSFMREQEPEIENPALPKGGVKRQTVEPSSGPAVEAQEQKYLTVATREKQVRKTTMLLAALFSIGVLCLWFMIKKSVPQAAAASRLAGSSTEEVQIEMAIARLTGVKSEMFSGIEKIVKKFYEFSDVQQVRVNELVKNPFMLEIFLVDAKESSDTEGTDSRIDADLMRQQQLREQAKNLQLQSIMQSDRGNCCMIDDKILYEGDSIKDFKVSQISDSFVKLELYSKDDKERLSMQIILKLSE